jgi:methylenetetrahydrofolate--tRNA-(uracil-5-)-methyltransferase
MDFVTIVGGGLAGCEAAWQLADRGVRVRLVEMRPADRTEAHRSDKLAEIVCSNSLKSTLPDTAAGVLKTELEVLGSRLLRAARASAVPAGHALAVDRDAFSAAVTAAIEGHPSITVERRRQDDLDLPRPAIVATGPLTAPALSDAIERHVSGGHLYFYDAIAPSIDAESLDSGVVYRASRYGKGEADYLNIPFSEAQYDRLIERIREADVVRAHDFEDAAYFEACLPIEVMAARGKDTARFGPMRPRGLPDPRTGEEPYAVVQLRQESASGGLLGLVGFQTRMTYDAQREVIQSMPGLSEARILRYGSIHRNMFLNLPAVCIPYQRDRKKEGLYYAGQICGVEGYVECIASGLAAALSVLAELRGEDLPKLPSETMIGSLMNHIHTPSASFQPMNANMGILPPFERKIRGRKARCLEASRRAHDAIERYARENSGLLAR